MDTMTRVLLVWLGLWFTGAVHATPAIQSWSTPKGARVLYVHAPELPMVDIRLVFDAGAARDGERAGIARLTNGLLDQGAAGLDAGEIARGFEQRGAIIGNGSERDMAWVSLRSLTDRELLEPSLKLFAGIIASPDFPEADFKRERQRMLVGLQYEEQKPGMIGEKVFYRNLYGDHPYGGHPSGTIETVKALTVAALRDFYRRYYVARNATVVIVGDVSEKDARAIATRLADGLAAGEKAPPLPEVGELQAGQELTIDFPSQQSHVLMGAPGLERKDPDYFALYVGNHILGGSGLVSRISEEIREKRGLSYSAYSYFIPMRERGPYQLGFQTRNDQREEALRVLRDTLQQFIDKGPSEDELEAAKNNIVGGFPIRISSNGKIAEYLAVIGFYDLPLDYLDQFTARVQAVTAKQIQDAFRRRVSPQHMVTVTVGGDTGQAGDS